MSLPRRGGRIVHRLVVDAGDYPGAGQADAQPVGAELTGDGFSTGSQNLNGDAFTTGQGLADEGQVPRMRRIELADDKSVTVAESRDGCRLRAHDSCSSTSLETGAGASGSSGSAAPSSRRRSSRRQSRTPTRHRVRKRT